MKIISFFLVLKIFLWPLRAEAQNLAAYQREAAAVNPALQARYKAFETALQAVAQARSLPDPQLSFGYFLSPVETRVGPQQARFSLSQMFPWFGTLQARGTAASLRAEARYQAFLEARNRLYYQVAEAYYPLYEWKQHLERERENQQILRSLKILATAQFQNGKGQMVDVLRVDIQLNESQTRLAVLEGQEKALKTQFNQLLNRPSAAEVNLPDTLMLKSLPADYRKDSLLSKHPLLREMELMAQASTAQEQAARLQGRPRLGVGLDYALVTPRQDLQLPRNGQDVLMPMLSLSLPIFRASYQAAIKEAQLRQDQYRLQEEARKNELQSRYDKGVFAVHKSRAKAALYQKQLALSRQSLSLLVEAYSNSGQDFEEILRMQQQIVKYQRLRASALTDFHQALARLNYITHK